jgi:hypothetical protein
VFDIIHDQLFDIIHDPLRSFQPQFDNSKARSRLNLSGSVQRWIVTLLFSIPLKKVYAWASGCINHASVRIYGFNHASDVNSAVANSHIANLHIVQLLTVDDRREYPGYLSDLSAWWLFEFRLLLRKEETCGLKQANSFIPFISIHVVQGSRRFEGW